MRVGSIWGALLLVAAGWRSEAADVLHLKDDSSISGKILARKSDQIAIDIGYTVLMVPRSQVTRIEQGSSGRAQKNAPARDHAVAPSPPAQPVADSSLFQSGGTIRADRSVKELSAVLGPAVVQVRTPGGLGSGFFVNEEGYLVTNFHVIENETQISVEVYPQRSGQLERKVYKQVRIVAMNKVADLALLKIEDAAGAAFPKTPLGDADSLSVGDRVFAIGSPLGLERTVTEGILSTKTRQHQGALYLQTTAQINPGNSGGPLFNLRGEVVGVINMKMTFGEGLGFAIPVDLLKYFLNHRDAFAYDTDNPSNAYRYLQPPKRRPQDPGGRP